ncbi:MAG: protein kinase [Pirellula sp.]|nr:protein kinase [Pirellula sp.]
MQPTSSSDDDLPSNKGTDLPTLDSGDSPARPNDQNIETASHLLSSSGAQEIAGRYKLLSIIGEGGMGSVWLAEQRVPVKRLVALKLIKSGMDSKAVVARFNAERQALAMMDHPNIARILDGGIAETGSPYFVMELVKGIPITEYCDSKKLTLKQRLELFVAVCQAIQHAHQKGIIHRDIKPSNVLVATYDDKAVPKVIDFGVAKATGAALTDMTIQTGFGVVGTPQYMSPEQATLNQLDIDTRSDIYSLGVLLYELLTGSPPFGVAELQKAGYMEMLRVIREEEPPRPSTKLSTADTLPKVAVCRSTEPTKLTGQLRSELDWVVMKAIEKDRVRRYETANAFAADIERYLSGAPVEAHPPSRAYQFRKFVRKYKASISVVSVIGVTMLAAIIATSYSLLEANRQKEIAFIERANAQKSEGEALEAYRSATDDAISDLMSSKEYLGPQEKIYLQKAMDRWNQFASRQGDDERSLAFRAEGLFRVGSILAYLSGSPDETLSQAETIASELCRRFPNNDRYEKLLSDLKLKRNHHSLSLDDQLSNIKASQQLLENIASRNPDSLSAKLDLSKSWLAIADAYFWYGDYSNSLKEMGKGISQIQKLLSNEPNNKIVLYELSNALAKEGGIYYEMRGYQVALNKSKQALDLSTRLLQMDPEDRKFQALQAMNLQSVGSTEAVTPGSPDSRRYLESAIQIARTLCDKYPNDAETLNLLAQFLNDYSNVSIRIDSKNSVEYAREAVSIQERLNTRYPETGSSAIATMRLNLIHKLLLTKQHQECIDLANVQINSLRSHIQSSEDDFAYQQRLIETIKFKGIAQAALNMVDEAEESFRETFQASIQLISMTTDLGVANQSIADSSRELLKLLKEQDKKSAVCEVYERLITIQRENNVTPLLFSTMYDYANYLVNSQMPKMGVEWAEKALEGFQSRPDVSSNRGATETFVRSCRLLKAKGLCLLGNHELANQEWETLLNSTDPKIQLAIRTQRSQVRFDAGLHREALEEINELVRSSSLPALTWLQFARIYAKHAKNDSEKSELSIKRAITLLAKGTDAGLADPTAIAEDAFFSELRDRHEFQAVLKKVKSKELTPLARQRPSRPFNDSGVCRVS